MFDLVKINESINEQLHTATVSTPNIFAIQKLFKAAFGTAKNRLVICNQLTGNYEIVLLNKREIENVKTFLNTVREPMIEAKLLDDRGGTGYRLAVDTNGKEYADISGKYDLGHWCELTDAGEANFHTQLLINGELSKKYDSETDEWDN